MSDQIHRKAVRRLRAQANTAADQFEATLLHNRVHERVDGQHTTDHALAAVLDASERAHAIDDREDVPDAVGDAGFDAGERLYEVVDELVEDAIARACATIVIEAADWADTWDQEQIAAAKHEAREWLQVHTEAAERAGVLEAVQVQEADR